MRFYEASALSVFAMFGLFLATVAGLTWLSASGGSRTLVWGLFVAALLLVIGCHFLHGRVFEIDPEKETITVSSIWLYSIRTSSTTRAFSELRDAGVEDGDPYFYVLKFDDGTVYYLNPDRRQRSAVKLLRQKAS